jgi:hypothetical protein
MCECANVPMCPDSYRDADVRILQIMKKLQTH